MLVGGLCALHDVHNAFKWSVNAFYPKKEYYRDTFVCASSCRNIALDCLEMLADWLPTVVESAENHEKTFPNKDVQRQFWLSFGCTSNIASILVDELCVWWDNGRFSMPEEVVMSGTYIEELSKVLHEVYSFKSFSASRWGSVGRLPLLSACN
eukprot:3855931-Amphidinium_carterae.1